MPNDSPPRSILSFMVPSGELFYVWITSMILLVTFLLAEILTGFVWWDCWAMGTFWGMGLGASGFIFGFLFAIPKAVQGKETPGPQSTSVPLLAVNTNLEQISDWLTKIIVGVTLIEIRSSEYYLGRLAEFIVKASCALPASTGIAMILFFGPMGFLSGYLLTRLYFSRLIASADREILVPSVSQLRDQTLPSLIDGSVDLKGDAKKAAESIGSLSPAKAAKQDIPLDALTIAQLGTGKPQSALNTIEVALRDDSTNPRLHYLRALALSQLNRRDDAAQSLLNARASLTPDSDPSLRQNIYNSLVYILLYSPPPNGFTQCIPICREYLRQDPSGIDGSIWVNLACAHGQAANFARQTKNDDNFMGHRADALSAIRKALEINNKWLPVLASLYRPTADQRKNGEDDLAVFEGDPDFDALLGRVA